ncbi:MAG: DUF1028 domain-containing protein [Marivirga sp.]|nr:DUF1028 domain-containing protein [Marivirga sp.]
MKRLITLLIFLILCGKVWATWSIILIDEKTGTIGIAGASCSPNCYGIGKILPGVGAIIVQAMSNREAREKGVQLILSGSTPEEIIRALREPDFDPERQQYAVLTLKYLNPETYTGSDTNPFNGALTARGISVQGNTLTTDNVLTEVFNAVVDAQKKSLSLDAVLMLALEAGSRAGGDKRCGEQRATSAFITVFKKADNPKKPSLNLNTFGQHKDGPNAVDLLKKQYERWIKKNARVEASHSDKLFNPVS